MLKKIEIDLVITLTTRAKQQSSNGANEPNSQA